jgi:CHASE3 domain sensor protein
MIIQFDSIRNRGDGSGETLSDQADDDASHDQMAEIEERIEALARTAERCRKFILASKIAIAGGVVLLLCVILGLFGVGQISALGSIALILGGIVSLGSNTSTLQQTNGALVAASMLRSDMIDAIDLSVVRDTPAKLM